MKDIRKATKEELRHMVSHIIGMGPARVMTENGAGISPRVAEKLNSPALYPTTIFIRKDGWTLGARPESLHLAYESWHDEWAYYISIDRDRDGHILSARLCDISGFVPVTDVGWTGWVEGETPLRLAEAGMPDSEIFLNNRYEVYKRIHGEMLGRDGAPPYPVWHLSIKQRSKAPVRNWRDLQRIKNELCGPESTGVEVFPPESKLQDMANQYHLFVMHPMIEYPIMFHQGRHVDYNYRRKDGNRQHPKEED